MPGEPTRTRTVIRRFQAEVEFHQVDMMHVVHNSEYFKWFEKGRLMLLEEIFPFSWALEQRIATPVVENHCEYLKPAAYGDLLVVTTKHRVVEHWDGRFLFEHSISNAKTKIELCRGRTAITVMDMNAQRLVKEIPEEIWQRYRSLA